MAPVQRRDEPTDHPFVQAAVALRSALRSSPLDPSTESIFREFDKQLRELLDEGQAPRVAGEEPIGFRLEDGTVDHDLISEHHESEEADKAHESDKGTDNQAPSGQIPGQDQGQGSDNK